MKKIAITLLLASLFSCQPEKEVSLETKVGQMFLLAYSGSDPDAVMPFIKERGIGGLYLSNENLQDPRTAAETLNKLQEASLNGPSGLPLLTAGDQEGAWGVMVPYSSTGPGNMALGAAPVERTREMYSVFSKELASVGMFCDLSPVADVNSNPLNPIIGTRSFGEDADKVAARVKAAVEGLHTQNIIATAKHFPGHGNTSSDSHSGLPKVSRSLEEIEAVDLKPFKAAIDAGVDMVMTAHIIYEALDPDNPSTLSKKILTGYLRDKLGFDGVIITDSFNMWAIQKNYDPKEAAVQAILAGADMIMLAEERYGEDVGDYVTSQEELIEAVIQAVKDGRISEDRINESYNRIKNLKRKYDLADRVPVDVEAAVTTVGNLDNKAQALKAAEGALTLIYDPDSLLPLDKNKTVTIVKLSVERVSRIIEIAEGIGPNYATAYQDFVEEMKAAGFDVKEKGYDHDIPAGSVVLAVAENYPLPGKSLDQEEQRRRLKVLMENNHEPVIYVGLRDPYDANLVKPDAYISAIGSNISNIRAMVNFLQGKVKAAGKLPVNPIAAEIN